MTRHTDEPAPSPQCSRDPWHRPLAGILLNIGVGFGAYWRSLPPAEFLDWFALNVRFVPRAIPVVTALALIGLVGSLGIGWQAPQERLPWMAALICVCLMLSVTAIWNGPLNHQFADGHLAAAAVPGKLRVWLTAHAARIVLVMTATVLGIVAIHR